jgi:hypothetical protein
MAMAKTRTRNRHGSEGRSQAIHALLWGAPVIDPRGSSGAGIAGRPAARIFDPLGDKQEAMARAIADALVPSSGDKNEAFFEDTARGLMAAFLIHSMTANPED